MLDRAWRPVQGGVAGRQRPQPKPKQKIRATESQGRSSAPNPSRREASVGMISYTVIRHCNILLVTSITLIVLYLL